MLPKNLELWLPGLLARSASGRPKVQGPLEVYFCLADHFEPAWHGADSALQCRRVQQWVERYPTVAAPHRDCEGRPPQHTFFFPQEQYRPELLDALAGLCRGGWGDVEVHLHHDHDTPAGLRDKLLAFTQALHHRHGLLRRDAAGKIRYGFIHGNWALNNSRPDGRWCGVDDETSILLETGCYADFTMPCAPNPAQSRKVNSLYYALPQKAPRAHDHGPNARVGADASHGLLMIQGPLGLRWHSRKWGLIPRIESADISAYSPPDAHRLRLWIQAHVHVEGAPERLFIKASTHGAQDANSKLLLFGELDTMWSHLEALSGSREQYSLQYVTAYEMYCKIKELEARPGIQPDV